MDDPLTEIEDANAQMDLGITLYRIFQGARIAGATRRDAVLILVGWTRGMFQAAEDDGEAGEEE